MKYRYYVTDLHAGRVTGTDDPELARQWAHDPDAFVVDSQEGKWLTLDDNDNVIESEIVPT